MFAFWQIRLPVDYRPTAVDVLFVHSTNNKPTFITGATILKSTYIYDLIYTSNKTDNNSYYLMKM